MIFHILPTLHMYMMREYFIKFLLHLSRMTGCIKRGKKFFKKRSRGRNNKKKRIGMGNDSKYKGTINSPHKKREIFFVRFFLFYLPRVRFHCPYQNSLKNVSYDNNTKKRGPSVCLQLVFIVLMLIRYAHPYLYLLRRVDSKLPDGT